MSPSEEGVQYYINKHWIYHSYAQTVLKLFTFQSTPGSEWVYWKSIVGLEMPPPCSRNPDHSQKFLTGLLRNYVLCTQEIFCFLVQHFPESYPMKNSQNFVCIDWVVSSDSLKYPVSSFIGPFLALCCPSFDSRTKVGVGK